MQVDIITLARKADIHRITPLTPALLSALERLLESGSCRCLEILDRRAKEVNSPPMKSALLSAAEEIRNDKG